jgi:hypothetical protein
VLGERDLLIVDEDTGRERFRARRLRQALLGPVVDERGHQRHLAKFTNLDTGKTHVAECPIGKPGEPRAEQSGGQFLVPDWKYPSLWHVERRPIRPEEFLPVLEALERIFRASVETGNPVLWC